MSSSKDDNSKQGDLPPENAVRRSIKIQMIRHAESFNNEVYRNARYIYRGGTPDFDAAGWTHYVDTHRLADPGLSDTGRRQAQCLAKYLVPHLSNQASRPVRFIISPMCRTLETIRPTLEGLHAADKRDNNNNNNNSASHSASSIFHARVHGFYFESEGCHLRDKPEAGMSPSEIKQLLSEHVEEGATEQQSHGTSSSGRQQFCNSIDFFGFPDPNRGWYCNGTGFETRAQSEERAARFYMWLLDTLDQELADSASTLDSDVFDAGVSIPGEEGENEHDHHAPRKRKRRTTILVGHGDFMSLVLKRIVAGFGHAVETAGVPHRSAFTHWNTGITELEYFGNGRFLVMCHNGTPHIPPDQYSELRSGGSLKDGWSYVMPDEQFILDAEVSVAFADEIEDHVKEQTQALKALYLSSDSTESQKLHKADSLSIEEEDDGDDEVTSTNNDDKDIPKNHTKHFIVKRGMQVVGVATYSERTGRVTDVAVRPSAGQDVSETLFNAVKEYSRKLGRSGSLLVYPRSNALKPMFEAIGFEEVDSTDVSELLQMQLDTTK